MSSPSIQELLGLPSDVTQPNAYQLFGLDLGESDPLVVDSAIKRRIASLKQAKSVASPETWKRAAIAVQAAQRTLQDPAAKAELDASFGIVSEPPSGEPSVAVDPLAGLLPPSVASAPKTASAPSAAAIPDTLEQPVPIPATPAAFPESSQPAIPATPSVAPTLPPPGVTPATAPVIRRRAPVRRRKSWGRLIFGTLMLAMMAALVGGLGYAYLLGPGKVQFVQTDDGFQIKTGSASDSNSVVSTPRQVEPSPQLPLSDALKSDGVMRAPTRQPMAPNKSLAADMGMGTEAGMGTAPPMAEPNNGMQKSPTAPAMPSQAEPSPAPSPAPTTTPPTIPTTTPPSQPTPPAPAPTTPAPAEKTVTPESIAIGKVAIDQARKAIKSANWEMMKTLAERAESMAVTPEQKQLAETLYQYADLATYYRGAILRAVPALPINSEIKITDTLNVLVNEADEKHLKINRGKDASGKPQYRDYPIDEIPLILVRAIAPYQMDVDTPEGRAAQAAYQAIWPDATAGVREESIQIFRNLKKVDGADPQRLADFLSTLNQ